MRCVRYTIQSIILLGCLLVSIISFANVQQPKISIVIDDVGNNYKEGLAVIHLSAPVIVSILPETFYSKQLAELAFQNHKPIIIHMPMQPLHPHRLGAGGLHLGMSKSQVENTLLQDFNSVPHAMGMNNHMGSLLTLNKTYMNWVMEFDKSHHLFYLDSLTNSKSIAYKIAKIDGIPELRRDFFLDNTATTQAINAQFQAFVAFAKEHGYAVAIAHPHPVVLAYLQQALPQLAQEGIQVIPITDELAHPVAFVPTKKTRMKSIKKTDIVQNIQKNIATTPVIKRADIAGNTILSFALAPSFTTHKS